jgi:molybdopterin synthase catalytic subunit
LIDPTSDKANQPARDEGGRLAAVELEHYPGMAEREIARICEIANERWPVTGLRHPPLRQNRARRQYRARSGSLGPPAGHVDAANFVVDYLKNLGALLEERAFP